MLGLSENLVKTLSIVGKVFSIIIALGTIIVPVYHFFVEFDQLQDDVIKIQITQIEFNQTLLDKELHETDRKISVLADKAKNQTVSREEAEFFNFLVQQKSKIIREQERIQRELIKWKK